MKRLFLMSALALCASAAFGSGVITQTLLTVREDGIPPAFSNVLATVSDMAKLQADLTIAAAKADVADQVYKATTQELMRVATQAVANRSIAYRRYFIDSWEAAMLISPDDKCVIAGFEQAPAERRRLGYESYDVVYAFKGHTDIRALKDIFKSNDVLAGGSEAWAYLDEALVDDPVLLPGPHVEGEVVFNYVYRTTVHFPWQDGHGFLAIAIQPQAADSDGTTFVTVGGDKDGANGTITITLDGTNVEARLIGGRVYTETGAL